MARLKETQAGNYPVLDAFLAQFDIELEAGRETVNSTNLLTQWCR